MKSEINTSIKGEFIIVIDESEARALEAIVGYGVDSFIKCFYQHLGKHYLQPHEIGLKTLFKGIYKNLSPQLKRVDKAREALKE
jgi:hypothetical protein